VDHPLVELGVAANVVEIRMRVDDDDRLRATAATAAEMLASPRPVSRSTLRSLPCTSHEQT
jgi:hypothetical protein